MMELDNNLDQDPPALNDSCEEVFVGKEVIPIPEWLDHGESPFHWFKFPLRSADGYANLCRLLSSKLDGYDVPLQQERFNYELDK